MLASVSISSCGHETGVDKVVAKNTYQTAHMVKVAVGFLEEGNLLPDVGGQ